MTDDELAVTRMNMREKIARAICEADVLAPNPDAPAMLGTKTIEAWEARLPMAGAVLAVLREPTKVMCEAGVKYVNTPPVGPINYKSADDFWQAMIDAATEDSE